MTKGIFSNKNISKINNRSLIISVNRKSALLENLVKLTWRYSFLIDRYINYLITVGCHKMILILNVL